MRETNADEIESDLAEDVAISPDGLTYTFILKDDLKWSDGKEITSADVMFTYNKRALFESNSYWQQVAISTPDPKTILFTIPSPRSDFLRQTTLGIIPMHIWSSIPDEEFENTPQNLRPVGSGPFSFVRLIEKNGIAKEIVLKRNRHYALTKSYIDRYRIVFFANQTELGTAIKNNDITMTASANSETAYRFGNSYVIDTIASSTLVSLFELKNAKLFSDATLTVLNSAVDKQYILDTIEYGYGILPNTAHLSLEETRTALHALGFNTRADGTLEKNGTSIGFSVAVENDPTVLATAYAFARALNDIGISITIKAFDPGTFQDVINRNEYQFIFGRMKREEIPTSYNPIITLYTSAYPLIHAPKLQVPTPSELSEPTDRYRESNEWYIRTNDVWKLFTK